MTSASRFGSGFLMGAVLGGLLLAAWSPFSGEAVSSSEAPVETTVPSVRVAPFLEAGEVLIDATAILPRSLAVEDEEVFFDYDLAGLGPTLGGHQDAQYPGDGTVVPERWVLTTTSGVVVEETTGPRDTSVRFALPNPGDAVATIELTGWRVAIPLGERMELEIVRGASGAFRTGTATIETILEQRASTIVQIDLDHSGDNWSNEFLRPLEPGWRVSGMQDGGVQLIWDGEDAPSHVVLEDFGFLMRPMSGNVLVIDERPES